MRAAVLIPFLLFASAAPGRAAESTAGPVFWGGGGSALTQSQNQDYNGFLVVGGIALPSGTADRQSIRFSLSHVFDASPIARSNLLCHFGYRITDRFGAGLLGGVEYLDAKDSAKSYLKALIGAEANFLLFTGPRSAVSLFTAYESARGSTGTIALDGGTAAESATFLMLGLVFSLGTSGN
jgi:hypothetical protein